MVLGGGILAGKRRCPDFFARSAGRVDLIEGSPEEQSIELKQKARIDRAFVQSYRG
jgi:hypothetical protein